MKKPSFLLSVLLLAACQPATNSTFKEGAITLTDALGREVTLVPGEAKRIVCIGAGALRLYSYIGDQGKLCGVERIEVESGDDGAFGYLNSPYALRPYQKVFGHYWSDLPSCGTGGPKAQLVEEEAILSCHPDLIISAYDTDKLGMDTLQNDLGVPVVTLSYGETEAFDQTLYDSLLTLGRALDKEERAQELVDYIEGIYADLQNRQKNISDTDRVRAYLAGQARYGLKSFESSTAQYSIFDSTGVINVLDEKGLEGYQGNVNLEDLILDSQDKIFLDASSLAILKGDLASAEKQEILASIEAVEKGEVYLQMPYNSYYTNLEIAYCDAYWVGATCYPEQYQDVDLEAKFNEITKTFLGVDFYDNPNRDDDISDVYYGGFQQVNDLFGFLDSNVK